MKKSKGYILEILRAVLLITLFFVLPITLFYACADESYPEFTDELKSGLYVQFGIDIPDSAKFISAKQVYIARDPYIEAEFEVNREQLKNVFNYTKWTFNQTVYALNVGEKAEITTSTDIYKCATVERIDDDTFKIYFQGFDVNSEYFK